MKVLITGSNGLLGSKLVKLFMKEKINFLATSIGPNRNPKCPEDHYQSMDITDVEEVEKVLKEFKPNAVIHTAAMTQVDACEIEKETCDLINIQGTENVFEVSKSIGAHFQLLSTDFVFDGENGPYSEDDEVHPLSYYAKSKVKAEQHLFSDPYKNWAVTRTIIVFGFEPHLSRSNIVLWAREALKKGETLKIVDDQFRAPTDADDLAWACYKIACNQLQGIYHISGPETKSIYEWVLEMVQYYKVPEAEVLPVSSNTLNQKAARPPRTGFVLDKSRLQFNYQPIRFLESLEKIEDELTFSK